MKFDTQQLDIQFKHIENEHIQKTIAYATIPWNGFPTIIFDEAFELFEKECPNGRISACTVCKSGDTYDKAIGEKIARKKLIRKYFRIVERATAIALKKRWSDIVELNKLSAYATDMQIDISQYIKKF